MNLRHKLSVGITALICALGSGCEFNSRMYRTSYDRVSILDRLYHKQENLDGNSTRKNYHAIAERVSELDRRFRRRLDLDGNGIVTEPEFRYFLRAVDYAGPLQENNGRDNFYGYCDDPVSHGHSEKVTFQRMRVHLPFLVAIRDHYELDPNLVEEFLER